METLLESGVRGEFPYAIHSNPLGFLLGYVGVPSAHPWARCDYDDLDVNVHGGLTYAAAPFEREDGVYPAAFDGVAWWVGFDCAHLGDLIPTRSSDPYGELLLGIGAMAETLTGTTTGGTPVAELDRETFKDRDYVSAEIDKLIAQAAEAS